MSETAGCSHAFTTQVANAAIRLTKREHERLAEAHSEIARLRGHLIAALGSVPVGVAE